MKKIILSISICTLLLQKIFSQTLPAPPWPITSDYGPRMLDKNKDGISETWNFHNGIDYGGGYGDPINPVEGGNINRIEYLEGGWNLRIDGTLGRWEYIHIFTGTSDATPVTSGNWELRRATLECPYTGETVQSNIIILWSGTNAEKVLSSIPNYWIKNPDGSYIEGTNGEKIKTRSSVFSSEVIAPVGNSGGVPTHLHLEYQNGADNPLLHVHNIPLILYPQ